MEPYTFAVTPLDGPRHRGQLSRALEKRSELISRDQYPKIWELTDRLNRVEKVPRSVRENRRRLRGWLGLMNWCLGVVLLMTGLMEPVLLLLAVGAAGYAAGVVTLWRQRRTLLGLLSLLQGAFFLLVGSGEFETMGRLLLLGVTGAVVGVAALATRKREKENPFDRAADELLRQRAETPDLAGVSFAFSEEGMALRREGIEACAQFPYAVFEMVLETEDLLLPVADERVTVLQKKDLRTGTLPELRAFLGERTRYVALEEPLPPEAEG